MIKKTEIPDSTAVRTALWRALHVQSDLKPHIIEDVIGLKLISPDEGWRERPDMDHEFTRRLRLSIAARSRYVEDLVIKYYKENIHQYVILGAGLDTFAQRKPSSVSALNLFEIDRLETQNWKKQRLIQMGYNLPEWLHFVDADFELQGDWPGNLEKSGFDFQKPALISCLGLSMYLTNESNFLLLKQISGFAPGSILALTFLITDDLVEKEDRELLEISKNGAEKSGTPFKSFFRPEEIIELALKAGYKDAKVISKNDIVRNYFSDRNDNLDPASGEEILLATT